MEDNKSQELQMDNTNIQGEINNETSINNVAGEGTKKRSIFKKAIKYVVIFVIILVAYNIFFTTSSIKTVKNTAFMNSYGNATTDTFGDYFTDGKYETLDFDIVMSDVQWSSERNDMGTGDIVTLSYFTSAVDTENEEYNQHNATVTFKWFVSDADDSVQCVYYDAFTPYSAGDFNLSGDDAQEFLYTIMQNGTF